MNSAASDNGMSLESFQNEQFCSKEILKVIEKMQSCRRFLHLGKCFTKMSFDTKTQISFIYFRIPEHPHKML